MQRSRSAADLASAASNRPSHFRGLFEQIYQGRSAMSSRAASPAPNSSISNIHIEPKEADDVFKSEKAASTTSETTEKAATSTAMTPTKTFTPRVDRLMNPITPENAQGVLPPEACVFVANLSIQHNDIELSAAVSQTFEQFGKCTVKIRRDRHRHPFALVQYFDEQAARHAIVGGNNLNIHGRKIRCEQAQARRSVVLTRVGGGPISKEEAQNLLAVFGPIDKMRPTTHQDGAAYGLPEGMYVQYAYYLDFKDCIKQFNSTCAEYKVVEAPNISEMHIPKAPASMTMTPNSEPGRTPRSVTDQKSVFVGNLPDDATEAELVEIFSQYGEIKGCNVIRKAIQGGHGYNIFGFVEFATPEEAVTALQELDIRGKRVRVEPKEYSARRHTRLQPAAYGPGPGSVDRSRAYGWGGPANMYAQAQGHALPFGFQPVYVPQGPMGMPPFQQYYGYAPTPPRTAPRQRYLPAPPGYHGSPPQHFLPPGNMPATNAFAFGDMHDALPDIEAEGHLHPPRRHY